MEGGDRRHRRPLPPAVSCFLHLSASSVFGLVGPGSPESIRSRACLSQYVFVNEIKQSGDDDADGDVTPVEWRSGGSTAAPLNSSHALSLSLLFVVVELTSHSSGSYARSLLPSPPLWSLTLVVVADEDNTILLLV